MNTESEIACLQARCVVVGSTILLATLADAAVAMTEFVVVGHVFRAAALWGDVTVCR